MPDQTRLEQELLTVEQRKLADGSRGAALAQLDDQALQKLISDLEKAAAQTGPATEDGQTSAQDLLAAALRRAKAERRKRKSPPHSEVPALAGAGQKPPAKPAKRAPASPARKPVGRERAEIRKADLRTGSRRVIKPGAKQPPEPSAPGAKSEPVAGPAAAKPGQDEKALKRAAERTERQAAREIERLERQAARKTEKEARKAARDAERNADRSADKPQKDEADDPSGKA